MNQSDYFCRLSETGFLFLTVLAIPELRLHTRMASNSSDLPADASQILELKMALDLVSACLKPRLTVLTQLP